MRSSTVQKPGTTTNVVTDVTDKVEVTKADILAGDGQVVASAVKPAKPDDKKLHWYRVTKGGFIGHSGIRARIPVGKDLHDGAYDIAQLKKQGIELEDLGEGPATGPLQATG